MSNLELKEDFKRLKLANSIEALIVADKSARSEEISSFLNEVRISNRFYGPEAAIENFLLIFVDSSNAVLVKSVLQEAAPFAQIIFVGPSELKMDVNFYSSVHYKNLELNFMG